MSFREFQPTDKEAVWAIWQDAFVGDHVEVREDWFEDEEETLFVWEKDSKVVGTVAVHRFGATRMGSVLPCGGIAEVAVDVSMRRGGIGRQMLEDTLALLKSREIVLASLYPFQEGWYRRLGFEVCGLRWRITAPTHRLPNVKTDLPLMTIHADAWSRLRPVHEAFCSRYSGMNPRSEERWMRVLKPRGKENTVVVAGEPAEAYAVMRLASEETDEQPVSEVAWSSPRGYAALLAILKQVGINHAKVSWYEPADSPFICSYLDADVSAKLARPIMFRLTDVRGAFRLLKPPGEGRVTVEVVDDQAQGGPFLVEWSGGAVMVEEASDAAVRAPIGALTQAFLGQPSFVDLVHQGRISVSSGGAFDSLSRLLPANPVYCMEFF